MNKEKFEPGMRVLRALKRQGFVVAWRSSSGELRERDILQDDKHIAEIIEHETAVLELRAAVEAIDRHWESGNFSRRPELWDLLKDALKKAGGE